MKLRCFVILIAILLGGCTSHSARHISVKFENRATMAFTGKGAAAGIMMDAYLGGAGIAIGIAIDEGIAKNIAENIAHSYPDFNIASVVAKELQRKSYRFMQPAKVEIITYGFRTVAGEGDLVAAWLTIKFTNRDGDVTINYPQDFSSTKTAELNLVKTNAEVAGSMLNSAVADVVNSWARKSTLGEKKI